MTRDLKALKDFQIHSTITVEFPRTSRKKRQRKKNYKKFLKRNPAHIFYTSDKHTQDIEAVENQRILLAVGDHVVS